VQGPKGLQEERFLWLASQTALGSGSGDVRHSEKIVGYSLGGGVAWQFAIRHRDLVRKLVVGLATYNNDGLYPEVLAGVEIMFTPEAFGIAEVPDLV
jgi:pimeloyl-ACP methyl ester carboxylesterase